MRTSKLKIQRFGRLRVADRDYARTAMHVVFDAAFEYLKSPRGERFRKINSEICRLTTLNDMTIRQSDEDFAKGAIEMRDIQLQMQKMN